MENFLKEPNKDELRTLASQIMSKERACIKISYSIDDLIFSFLVLKYGKSNSISFESNECEIKLITNDAGKILEFEGKQYYLGRNSFTSMFPLSVEDVLPILGSITANTIFERRDYTQLELDIINDLTKFGVLVEQNLKIPNYKSLPLFFSLMLSFDPYIPEVTGNRENSIKILKDINVSETDKLDEIDEAKLNSLIYRIISSIIKVNSKFSRENLVSNRVFYLEYDSLELAFALIYFLDTRGAGDIFQFTVSPSYAETIIYKFREELSKGFSVKNIEENNNFYIVETDLKSPTLVQLIMQQTSKIKKAKPIAIKTSEGVFTSRTQLLKMKEGLNKIENKS